MKRLDEISAAQLRDDIPEFRAGATVAVEVRIREGEKERLQKFEGTVIKLGGKGVNKTFTVRKVSDGVGVERIFPMHSPGIASIKILKAGKVRRAKIYYLRKLRGKAARIQEKR